VLAGKRARYAGIDGLVDSVLSNTEKWLARRTCGPLFDSVRFTVTVPSELVTTPSSVAFAWYGNGRAFLVPASCTGITLFDGIGW
jgi:hypothetical protein